MKKNITLLFLLSLLSNFWLPRSALIILAFAGSLGMTLVILGCALPVYKVWWPSIVVIFYILTPLPTLIAHGREENLINSPNRCLELATFITMGFVVSSFALPIILARSPSHDPVIQWGACYLTLAGNVVMYLTLLGFFLTVDTEEYGYMSW